MNKTNENQAQTDYHLRSRVSALRFVLGLFGSHVGREDADDFCRSPTPDPDVTLEEELAAIQHDMERSDDLDPHLGGEDLERHDEFCPHGGDCDDVSCELVTHADTLARMLMRAECELAASDARQRHIS